MATLLEKAQAIRLRDGRGPQVQDEQIELALAFLSGNIRFAQARRALHADNPSSGMSTYITLCRALLEAYRRGKLTIN
jgi:hypothetical protein